MKLQRRPEDLTNQFQKLSLKTERGGALILSFLIVALHLGAERMHAATVNIYSGNNIPTIVSNSPAGTTFVIYPGLYRLQTPIPAKNGDTFTGLSAPVLSGARLLTSFQHTGFYYYVTGQTQQGQVTAASKQCQPGYPGCMYPEDLYFDDVPLVHVTSLTAVGPGTWFFDYPNNIIYFYDNPAGHKVETSVTPSAFAPGPANNVTIQGLTVEKFATPLLLGAIGGAGSAAGSTAAGANWVVQNNEIRLNHGNGVRPNYGWQVLNNHIHDNGNLGIGGGIGSLTVPCRVLIQGNEIAYNNYAHVKSAWQAGGLKMTLTEGLVIRGNHSHDNDGDGLKTDSDNYRTLYDDNTVQGNTEVGLMHEISHSATIRNNRLQRNGYINPNGTAWLYAANLLSATSSNVEAYCNTVEVSAQGGNGIDMLAQYRPDFGGNHNPSTGNYFHHNTVVFDGNSGVTGGARDDPAYDPNFFSLNRFDYNTYHLPDLTRKLFSWTNKWYTFAQFQALGQEAHGSADTNYTASVPTVAITSPADGSTASGVVYVAGNAQGAVIQKVEFYVDWSLKQTGFGSTFGFAWSTFVVSNGEHTVTTMAYGLEGTRACYAVTLNVQN
jgi:parallel beta-helix repeat protein